MSDTGGSASQDRGPVSMVQEKAASTTGSQDDSPDKYSEPDVPLQWDRHWSPNVTSRSVRTPGSSETSRRSSLPVRKKSAPPDPRATGKKKASHSPLMSKRPLGESGAVSTSSTRLRHVPTSESQLSSSPHTTDGHHSQDDDTVDSFLNGGSSSDAALDDWECGDGHTYDPTRTKAAIGQLQNKIHRTMELIKSEQDAKEDNVNEYLRLSANADKQQQQRIKNVFEKKNQKSTQSIAQLQRKLEAYQKRLKEVELYGVSGHKQAKEVLRDVGQGLKGVVDNIRGAKETIVSKPKEFAHLIKNKFGSADNINNIKQLEEGQGSADDGEKQFTHHGSGTLPARYHRRQDSATFPSASFKYGSDDETSSVTSGSGPSGVHNSPRAASQTQSSLPATSVTQISMTQLQQVPQVDLEPIRNELHENRQAQRQIQLAIESFKVQMAEDFNSLKTALEEERFRSERLEEQINDLTELHQHEVTNIKQELSSMEEKMEYQLEERTRDMQELLDQCQTRITKMELQQQQQQLISMEGIENSNFRALLTKLINVVLALLAVLLVFVSTVANLLGPFLTTRLRIMSTICLIASIIAMWQHWMYVKDFGQGIIDRYRHYFPPQ